MHRQSCSVSHFPSSMHVFLIALSSEFIHFVVLPSSPTSHVSENDFFTNYWSHVLSIVTALPLDSLLPASSSASSTSASSSTSSSPSPPPVSQEQQEPVTATGPMSPSKLISQSPSKPASSQSPAKPTEKSTESASPAVDQQSQPAPSSPSKDTAAVIASPAAPAVAATPSEQPAVGEKSSAKSPETVKSTVKSPEKSPNTTTAAQVEVEGSQTTGHAGYALIFSALFDTSLSYSSPDLSVWLFFFVLAVHPYLVPDHLVVFCLLHISRSCCLLSFAYLAVPSNLLISSVLARLIVC